MKKPLMIFITAVFLVCAVGIALIITGNALQNATYRTYSARSNDFEKQFTAIKTAYAEFGDSDKTKYAIGNFISRIPEDVRDDNNIVIADGSGKIVYKTNDLFLTPPAERLNLIWNTSYYAIMQDAGTGQNTRLRLKYMDDWSVWRDNDSMQIGEIKNNGNIVEMMSGYDIGQDARDTVVSILTVETKQTRHYIIWFRYANTDGAIDSSFSEGLFTYSDLNSSGVILILIYWLLLPVWVFLDARRRQTQPLPWALLVLLTNVVGLIVYWIVQTQNGRAAPASACPACGKAVKKGYPYCPWCAAPLVKACKECGKTLEPGWKACPWCGKPVD